jgi:D-alanyl-D-alanine carboxypeptidase
MTTSRVRAARALVAAAVLGGLVAAAAVGATGGGAATSADAKLDAALEKFVAAEGGPPGIAVVVQTGATPELHTAGVADVATGAAITIDDWMRLASVAKAFSGAAALALYSDGTFSTTEAETIGSRLPDMPEAWADITLPQLLQHTSGIPDFSASEEFREAVQAAPDVAPPPEELVAFVAEEPLDFPPGSRYRYSNTDNILVGLMVEAASGQPYEEVLATKVYGPLGLTSTSLPAEMTLPAPTMRGYAILPSGAPEDATEAFDPRWAWASGGIASTPADANRFVRGYVAGDETSPWALLAQFRFRRGSSEPPGPGKQGAGMAIFRYQTGCGTVYGHTGNTAGYTQFVAATRDGQRSVTVSINAQITPKSDPVRFKDLRRIFGLGVCAALEGATSG